MNVGRAPRCRWVWSSIAERADAGAIEHDDDAEGLFTPDLTLTLT